MVCSLFQNMSFVRLESEMFFYFSVKSTESRCFACKAGAGGRVSITQRMENICKMSRSPVFHGIRHLKMSQMVSLEDYRQCAEIQTHLFIYLFS